MLDFFAPDAQSGDAYAWLANQAAHWALGIVLAWIVDRWTSRETAAVAAALCFVGWEALQLAAGGAPTDSLADFAFVALGAAWGRGSWFGLALLAAGLSAGVAARV